MARFRWPGSRNITHKNTEGDEPTLELISTGDHGVVESIGTKYTMVEGARGSTLEADGRFGPETAQKGREGWIEVIAAKDDESAGLMFDNYESGDTSNVTGGLSGEQPQGLFWQGLVENQNVVGGNAEAHGFQALTKNELRAEPEGPSSLLPDYSYSGVVDNPSTFSAADGDNGDTSIVFQKIDSITVEASDGADHLPDSWLDNWEPHDV